MKCNFCGYESQEDFAVCPVCSQNVAPAAPVNPVGEKVMAALKDKLFLVLCILMTAAAGLSLISGRVPVLEALFSIFLWLAYSKAKNNVVDTNQLKNVSGTVYAQYVLMNVAAGIFLVCGVVCALLMGVLGMADFSEELLSQFGEFNLNIGGALAMASGWIIFVVFAIAAGLILVINLLGWRKIHRFAKSVYQSINTYTDGVVYANAAKNWILAFGIIDGISALTSGDFMTILVGGAGAAASIIAYLLLNKYLTDKQQ